MGEFPRGRALLLPIPITTPGDKPGKRLGTPKARHHTLIVMHGVIDDLAHVARMHTQKDVEQAVDIEGLRHSHGSWRCTPHEAPRGLILPRASPLCKARAPDHRASTRETPHDVLYNTRHVV